MTRFNDVDIQRFVDQELQAEERVAFIATLGRDGDLRERVLALETLALSASKLPRHVVPDRFVADVMRRVETAPWGEAKASQLRQPWRQMMDAILRPRSLQWNLAGAAAAACLVALAVWAAVFASASRSGSSPLASATSSPDTQLVPVLVRLIVVQPEARTVQVAGDFNGWNPSSTTLTQTSAGAWTITLPLPPGRYEYQFVIDGQTWIADPFATELNDDGFGSRNAVIDVRAPDVVSGGSL